MFQAKWLWLAAFPLAFMLVDALKDSPKEKVKTVLIVMVGIGFFMGANMVINSQPTEQQIYDLQEIATLTNSIDNSWHFGHWLRYYGVEPLNDNLEPGEAINSSEWNNTWALSHEVLNRTDYGLYKNYTWGLLYKLNYSP